MKLEAFLKTGIIIVAVLACIFLIIGNELWQESYDVTSAPSFLNINKSRDNLQVIRSSYENTTLLKYAKRGEAEEDTGASSDIDFIEYQARSYEGAGKAVSSSGRWFSTIEDLLNYIGVPVLIVGTIIILLIISIGFAFIAFWRGKRA